ncbi:MAG: ATP-dependent helicase HrpB [Ilumatobacteraceae bacterium]
MLPAPPDLPVVDVLPELGSALATATRAILVAPPGAGKTTLAPLHLLDAPWLDGARIILLEPRRLAARAAARRMSDLLGERVGDTVGLQTRDERHLSARTRLEVVTEGVLTRRLQHDPTLEGYGLVVFDEVHERNLPTDLGLALTLDVRRTVRPDLRLLAMSATADVVALRRLLGDDTPVVESDGRLHPVEIIWAPPLKGARPAEATADLVRRALREQSGSVLVFLPGIGEIRAVEQLLRGSAPDDVDVFPLAGALSTAEQDAALAPSPPGRRRVVLSTDIAESSLTVDGVRVVVDAGRARVPRFDQRTGMTRLTTISASRASADQRSGRAGRLGAGVAYRAWTRLEHGTRRAHLEAEITQTDLADLALELAAWGTPVDALDWIDRPPARVLRAANDLLVDLGALDPAGRMTPLGRRMLDLPLHPRLSRMVAEAAPTDRSTACVIAALLDERDIFTGRPDERPADVALRVAAVRGEPIDAEARVDRRALDRLRERATDLARRLGDRLDTDDCRPDRCGAVLALAYPDRVAVRRGRPGQFQLRSGARAWTPETDQLAGARFVVAADLDGRRDGARIRLGAVIEPEHLTEVLADQVEQRSALVWDRERDDLVERTEIRLGGLVVDERVGTPSPGPAVVEALVARVAESRLGILHWSDEAVSLRRRVAFLRHEFGESWPDWSDEALIDTLDEWLTPFLAGATGRADIDRLDLAMLLTARLDWDTASRMATLAPPALVTPTGRHAPIDYSSDTPRVAVRVQDLFGTTTHPTIAEGRVALVLELLSPADRPLQVTSDLPGFWRGSWAEVRKEMAGRYPKHHWPVDPASAPPRRLGNRD